MKCIGLQTPPPLTCPLGRRSGEAPHGLPSMRGRRVLMPHSPVSLNSGQPKALAAQELEARGVRIPAGWDRWDAKQVSRLLAA